jgi:hypothetical protein
MGQCKSGKLCILRKRIPYLRSLSQVGWISDLRLQNAPAPLSPQAIAGRGIRIADFQSFALAEFKIYNLKYEIGIAPSVHEFAENAIDECQNFLSTRRTF